MKDKSQKIKVKEKKKKKESISAPLYLPHINIAYDFHVAPAGRYRHDGPYSAQAFREDVLLPALQKAIHRGKQLVVNFDETEGVSSAFLEEAFGGLISRHHLSLSEMSRLKLEGKSSPGLHYASIAETYIFEASKVENQMSAKPSLSF